MKNIFYFFNYFEWIVIICTCGIFYIPHDDSFQTVFLWLTWFFITSLIVMSRFDREFYTYNAYKYKCVYKTHQIIIDENVYYVPIVDVYTHVGSRYIRLIDNEKTTHVSDISLFHFKSRIAQNGYEIPDGYMQYCYKTEEDALYEITNCKKYIDAQKRKYSRKIVSNEVTVEFKNQQL